MKNLFRYFLKIHNIKFFAKNIFLSVALENFIALIRQKDTRFSYIKKKNLIKAQEKNLIMYYTKPKRCFWLYRNGISLRGQFIHKSYCIDKINFSKSDVVLDCGANSGDLFIELENCISSNNYIGIEPNPEDFKVLNLNCPNTTLINKALGLNQSFLDFFIATSNGDSSLNKAKKFS